MKIKSITFRGGYRFKRFKGQPREETVTLPLPDKVILPLKRDGFEEAMPCVEVGQKVLTGQLIARDDNSLSSPIHSSISGMVESVKKITLNGVKTAAVIIKPGQSEEWAPAHNSPSAWDKMTEDELDEILYISGVSSLGSNGIPTRFNSSRIGKKDVKDIIVAHTDSDVFNVSIQALLGDAGMESVITGLKILGVAFQGARVHVVLSRNQKKIIKELASNFSSDQKISVYGVKPKYPQDNRNILISSIPGINTHTRNIPVFNLQDIVHIYEAVVKKKPLVERVVAFSGSGFEQNRHYRLRLGTLLEDILKGKTAVPKSVRFIMNSVLNGKALDDLDRPLTEKMHQIIAVPENHEGELLAFARPGMRKDSITPVFVASFLPFGKKLDTNINGEERACISCGFCADVCPSRLLPQLLHRYAERNIINEKLVQYRIEDCVDCNLCTYVCTSKIPVAALIKKGKEKLAADGLIQEPGETGSGKDSNPEKERV
ncbi:MAG: 4Fe-4S dicluster domain-containing protein [Spirochaetales bacterium]|nr:4Fe-4S dicluster domain-containing protein [Spirochaetales bacterium]